MTYRAQDAFPGALPSKQVTVKELVDALSPAADYPVVYIFGGGAPASIAFGVEDAYRMVLSAEYTGPFGPKSNAGITQTSGRWFIEFSPTSWNPLAPDYGGH